MALISQLKEKLEDTQSIALVTQALGEIAAVKLKNTRNEVMQNIAYFNEISSLYHTIKILAKKRGYSSKRQKNGRTVCVLLTSNYHFYGGLDLDLTNKFVATTKKLQTDMVVVGRAGKDLLNSFNFQQKYFYLQFKKDLPDTNDLLRLFNFIVPYSRILVFHSEFVTVLKQAATISDVSEPSSLDEARIARIDYILEPEVEKITKFFEEQILILLFQAILLQAQLARTAARMISMYDAEDNAKEIIKQQKRDLSKAKISIQNIKILETFAQIKNLLEKINT